MRYITIEVLSRNKAAKRNDKSLLIDYYEKDIKETGKTGLGKYFISFTSIPKLGINPNNEFGTPTGIYCYPLKQMYKHIIKDTIPFASERPYIQVLELNTDKILYSPKYKESNLEKDENKIKKLFTLVKDENLWKKFLLNNKLNLDSETLDSPIDYTVFDRVCNGIARFLAKANGQKEKPFYKFWVLTWQLSQLIKGGTYQHYWNSLLRKLGYEVIIDNGSGAIHPHEKTQTLVLVKTAINHVDMIDNTKEVNFVKSEDRVFTKKNLPDNFTYDGDLELTGKIPENLQINGKLTLTGKILEIPHSLNATTLVISQDCSITRLPENLVVQNLYISSSNISKLPPHFVCSGELDISNTKITDISCLDNKIIVSLNIKDTKITKLPKNLKTGSLNISNTDIEEIPEGLHVKYSFIAINCKQIKKYSSDFVGSNCNTILVGSSITFYKGKIISHDKVFDTNRKEDAEKTSLPDNLHLIGMNITSTSKLKQLPKGLHVEKDINISSKKIKEIPDDLKCNYLFIHNCDISHLPKTIDIKNLYIENTNITTLDSLNLNLLTGIIHDIDHCKIKQIDSWTLNKIHNSTIDEIETNSILEIVSCTIGEIKSYGDDKLVIRKIKDSKIKKVDINFLDILLTGNVEIENLSILRTARLHFDKCVFTGNIYEEILKYSYENIHINGSYKCKLSWSIKREFNLFVNSVINGDIYIDGSNVKGTVTCLLPNTKVTGTIYATKNILFQEKYDVRNI